MKSFRNRVIPFVIFIFFGILTSCSHLTAKKTTQPQEGSALFDQLAGINGGVKSIKTLGYITLHAKGRARSFRAAWVAAVPSKLRVEMLGAAGGSMATLAYDGQSLYLRSPEDYHRYTTFFTDPGRILGADLKMSELVMLLAARVPIDHSTRAEIEEAAGRRIICLYKKRDGRIKMKIYTGKSGRLERIDFFDKKGRLSLSASFFSPGPDSSFKIPGRILLASASGLSLELRLERVWINEPVSGEIFRLKK